MNVTELIAQLRTLDPWARVDVMCDVGAFPLGDVSPSQGDANSVLLSPDYDVRRDRPGLPGASLPSKQTEPRISHGQAWLVTGTMAFLAAALAYDSVCAHQEGATLIRQLLLAVSALLCPAFGALSLFAETRTREPSADNVRRTGRKG